MYVCIIHVCIYIYIFIYRIYKLLFEYITFIYADHTQIISLKLRSLLKFKMHLVIIKHLLKLTFTLASKRILTFLIINI